MISSRRLQTEPTRECPVTPFDQDDELHMPRFRKQKSVVGLHGAVLGRHGGAFDQGEEIALHAFARHVGAGNRGAKKVLPHSALIPNSLMSGHHFSISAFCKAASASGVCWSRGKISISRAAKRDRTAGSASASTDAALSLPMMSFGVPLGAKSPTQLEWERAGNPISAKVGMSGAIARR